MNAQLELIPGCPGEPLFATPEEYEEFREWFYEAVREPLEEARRKRLASEYESHFHIVN